MLIFLPLLGRDSHWEATFFPCPWVIYPFPPRDQTNASLPLASCPMRTGQMLSSPVVLHIHTNRSCECTPVGGVMSQDIFVWDFSFSGGRDLVGEGVLVCFRTHCSVRPGWNACKCSRGTGSGKRGRISYERSGRKKRKSLPMENGDPSESSLPEKAYGDRFRLPEGCRMTVG